MLNIRINRLSKQVIAKIIIFSLFYSLSIASWSNSNEDEYPREKTPATAWRKTRQYSLVDYKSPESISVNRNTDYKDINVEDLLHNVFVKTGSCSSIENIKVKVLGWDNNKKRWTSQERGLAYFEKADSDFPMQRGLILSTADAREAEGPNSRTDAMSGYVDRSTDKDLNSLLPKGSQKIDNFTYIEFDFIPTGSKMEFKYIFASEEYPYYVNSQYNDVFGFFISSLDNVTKKTNIAIIEDSHTGSNVVSINNINNGRYSNYYYTGKPINPISNSSYFIPNPLGASTTEFNGYTKILTAKADVIPCKKYRLKIAIGNTGDSRYGSGVFLEANSFNTSDQIINVVDDKEEVYNVFDGKNSNTKFVVTTSSISSYDTTIQLDFAGTAINGVDYTDLNGRPLKTSYVVPKGKNRIEIPYIMKQSALNKYIEAKLFCPCIGGSVASSQVVRYVKCLETFEITATPLCDKDEFGTISVDVTGSSHLYEYSKDGIKWQTSNVFEHIPTGKYTIYARDQDGCQAISKEVTLEALSTPDAGLDRRQCGNPHFNLEAQPSKSFERGYWSIVSPSNGAYIEDVNSPSTIAFVPEGKKVTFRWTITYAPCNSIKYDDVTFENINDNNKHKNIIVAIDKKDITGSKIEINLNNYFAENPLSKPNWLPASVSTAVQFNSETGILTLNKEKLLPRVSSFRYTTDHCGEPLFHTIYINVTDK